MKIKNKSARSKLRSISATPTPDSAGERVAWLLHNVWQDKRSEMARAIGCTPSVLTKIALGQQQPGRRLLAAIGSHAKINPAWLMSGVGEPLLAERAGAPSDDWPLPIARQPLPGPPDGNRSLLTGETFIVAGPYYRPTRYWLEIPWSDPLVQVPAQRIAGKDLLLMECDREWRKSFGDVDQRFCIVRSAKDSALSVGFVQWVSPDEADEPGELKLTTYPRISAVEKSDKKKPTRHPPLHPPREAISLADIVAVHQLLVRRP